MRARFISQLVPVLVGPQYAQGEASRLNLDDPPTVERPERLPVERSRRRFRRRCAVSEWELMDDLVARLRIAVVRAETLPHGARIIHGRSRTGLDAHIDKRFND